jgi:hypothetical protein
MPPASEEERDDGRKRKILQRSLRRILQKKRATNECENLTQILRVIHQNQMWNQNGNQIQIQNERTRKRNRNEKKKKKSPESPYSTMIPQSISKWIVGESGSCVTRDPKKRSQPMPNCR